MMITKITVDVLVFVKICTVFVIACLRCDTFLLCTVLLVQSWESECYGERDREREFIVYG